jgi:hypothetical protein
MINKKISIRRERMQLYRIAALIFIISILNINLLNTAQCKEFNATITDINGIETDIQGLWIRCGGNYYYAYSDISIKVGEASQDVSFDKIKEIDLKENPNDKDHQIIDIISISGKTLSGISGRSSTCSFEGKTDFGDFSLDLGKTKKVVFET